MAPRSLEVPGGAVRNSFQMKTPQSAATIVAPLLKRLDVDFEVDDLVSDLSLAQRQLLEIAKALSLSRRLRRAPGGKRSTFTAPIPGSARRTVAASASE